MTNAEFLNKNFRTNYKGYMKSRWTYSNQLKVWMTFLDGKVRRGWKNIINDCLVFEEFVSLDEKLLPEDYILEENYRLIVDKAQNYKILGVYKLERTNGNVLKNRIWIKVANSLEEFLQK